MVRVGVFVIYERLARQKANARPATLRPGHFDLQFSPMTKKLVVLGVMLLAAASPTAQAQRSSRGSNPIELGIDGGILFGLDNPKTTLLSLPVQDFRIGFLVTDRLAFEPRVHLNMISGSGSRLTTYAFEIGLVYSPAGDRVGNGLYGRPFMGISGFSASGGGPGSSDNSGYAGLGVGLKLPFADRRLATRLEANYAHGFSNGGTNQIGLLFGLSFFTR